MSFPYFRGFAVASILTALVACGSSSPSSDATASDPLGPACSDTSACQDVTCSCIDGTTQDLGKVCVGGVCYTADTCTRLHGICAAHGGVVNGQKLQKPCTQLSDCPYPAYCGANTKPTNCPPIYECSNDYCVWDDACKDAPKTCQ